MNLRTASRCRNPFNHAFSHALSFLLLLLFGFQNIEHPFSHVGIPHPLFITTMHVPLQYVGLNKRSGQLVTSFCFDFFLFLVLSGYDFFFFPNLITVVVFFQMSSLQMLPTLAPLERESSRQMSPPVQLVSAQQALMLRTSNPTVGPFVSSYSVLPVLLSASAV